MKQLILEVSSSVIHSSNEGQKSLKKQLVCAKGWVQGKRSACVRSSDFRYNTIRWKIRQVVHYFIQGT